MISLDWLCLDESIFLCGHYSFDRLFRFYTFLITISNLAEKCLLLLLWIIFLRTIHSFPPPSSFPFSPLFLSRDLSSSIEFPVHFFTNRHFTEYLLLCCMQNLPIRPFLPTCVVRIRFDCYRIIAGFKRILLNYRRCAYFFFKFIFVCFRCCLLLLLVVCCLFTLLFGCVALYITTIQNWENKNGSAIEI